MTKDPAIHEKHGSEKEVPAGKTNKARRVNKIITSSEQLVLITVPVQLFDPGETFILRCFPEKIKELFGHKDLDNKHHGSDIEMPHIDNHDETRNHP